MNQTNQYLNLWLKGNFLSKVDRKKLKTFTKVDFEKKFNGVMTLKTSGFRAPIGLGSTQFNQYNVSVLIKAFCVYLTKKTSTKNKTILIFHDHRKEVKNISRIITEIIRKHGMIPKLFPKNKSCPTPFLSYLLTQKPSQYAGGIMMTASHNPKEFNGCKLYQNSGQILTKHQCHEINHLIKTNYEQWISEPISKKITKINAIPETLITKYFTTIINNFAIPSQKSLPKMTIWYSSLHGTGKNWTDQLLVRAGFKVKLVPKQSKISDEFFSIKNPNPEDDATIISATKQIGNQSQENDLLITNDGDADRIRISFYHQKQWHLLSGNELATILSYYLITEKKRRGIIFKTWVSTPIIDQIVKDYDSEVTNVETGFSHLAAKYRDVSKSDFILAFEESLGYLVDHTINQDKDGIQTSLIVAEIHCWLLKQKLTWQKYLNHIYQKYGFYAYQTNKYRWNEKQQQQWTKTINTWKIGDQWAKFNLTEKAYDKNYSHYSWKFDHGIKVYGRASKTEPIIKIYFFCHANSKQQAITDLNEFITIWTKQILLNFK